MIYNVTISHLDTFVLIAPTGTADYCKLESLQSYIYNSSLLETCSNVIWDFSSCTIDLTARELIQLGKRTVEHRPSHREGKAALVVGDESFNSDIIDLFKRVTKGADLEMHLYHRLEDAIYWVGDSQEESIFLETSVLQ